MDRELVVSVVGAERPGVVEAISACLIEHGGNWTESRLARIADRFAGVVCVTVAEDAAPALIAALEQLGERGIHIFVDTASRAPADSTRHKLDLTFTGRDRPGIVHGITSVLAEHGIEIEEFETRSRGERWSSGTMFDARAILSTGEVVDVQALTRALEAVNPGMLVTLHAFSKGPY